MKLLAALFFFAASVLHAEEPLPFILSGVLRDGSVTRVALTASAGGESKWVNIGQQFQGYQIVSYDEKSTTLLVLKGDTKFQIALQDAKIALISTSLTPEARNRIRNNLRQLWAAAQQHCLETGKTSATFNDLVGEGKLIKAIETINGEDYTALVVGADAKSITVSTSSGETVSFAEGVYTIKPGDSGAKIARANSITLADLQTLNPDVNWTKLKVGQVITVSAEPK